MPGGASSVGFSADAAPKEPRKVTEIGSNAVGGKLKL